MSRLTFFIIILILFTTHPNPTEAYSEPIAAQKIDTVIIATRRSKLDVRKSYTHEILEEALRLSVDKYGAYKTKRIPISIPHDVTFYELSRGTKINVTMSAATPDKDNLAIPIRIPIRRGILNYRLLLINKGQLDLFKKITNMVQLKSLTAGMHSNAVTVEIMEALDFNVVEGSSYDGMFKQLSLGRFDYIPRGVHEAYDEIELRKDTVNNLIIEPNLALYMPMPYYIYVSPKFPRLAERLEYGLEKMIEQKLIKKIFDRYYAEDIKRANLAERTIIDIGNPFLSPDTPFYRRELWIDEYAIKTSKTSAELTD